MLSGEEVIRFLEAVSSLKARVALTTAYAAGLRVSEVTSLKITDIDSVRRDNQDKSSDNQDENAPLLA